jgi:hypothetical protein
MNMRRRDFLLAGLQSDHPVGEVASPVENGEAGFGGAPIDHEWEAVARYGDPRSLMPTMPFAPSGSARCVRLR